ncbi:MAG: acyl carrier protein, partial [Chloroflexota bacterium]
LMSSGAEAVTEMINSYSETIGWLEQTTAGEHQVLDPLLSRTKTPVAPPPQTEAVDSAPATRSQSFIEEEIQDWLIRWIIEKLQLPAEIVESETAFADYGLDSLSAIELASDLEDWLEETHGAITVDTTLAWSYPTIKALARFLGDIIEASQTDSASGDPSQELVTAASSEASDQSSESEMKDLTDLAETDLATLLAEEIDLAKKELSE